MAIRWHRARDRGALLWNEPSIISEYYRPSINAVSRWSRAGSSVRTMMHRMLSATTWDEAEGEFRCERCGFQDRIWAHAQGVGEVDVTFRRASKHADAAAERARSDAQRTIAEAVAAVACPECKHRDPGAARRVFWRRIGAGLVVATPASMIGLMAATSADANPIYGMVIAFMIVLSVTWFVAYRRRLGMLDRQVSFMSR